MAVALLSVRCFSAGHVIELLQLPMLTFLVQSDAYDPFSFRHIAGDVGWPDGLQ